MSQLFCKCLWTLLTESKGHCFLSRNLFAGYKPLTTFLVHVSGETFISRNWTFYLAKETSPCTRWTSYYSREGRAITARSAETRRRRSSHHVGYVYLWSFVPKEWWLTSKAAGHSEAVRDNRGRWRAGIPSYSLCFRYSTVYMELSLRKQPFLLALRRLGCFVFLLAKRPKRRGARKDGCFSQTNGLPGTEIFFSLLVKLLTCINACEKTCQEIFLSFTDK